MPTCFVESLYNVCTMNATSHGSRAIPKTRPSARKLMLSLPMPFHLALKEIWRNKSRFFLISVVVALITLLVLFTAGLAEGLGLGNREYISKVDADLIVYQSKAELLIPSSRINEATLRDLRQVDGVQAVGAVAWTNVTIVLPDNPAGVKVSLAGVLAGRSGEPPVVAGQGLSFKRGAEAIIDRSTAVRTNLKPGDPFKVRSIVGNKEKLYDLTVAGVSDSQQYSLQPTIFVPHLTWEKIRPRASSITDNLPGEPSVIFNVALVKLNNPADAPAMSKVIEHAVAESKNVALNIDEVRAVSKQTAWENTPGYSAQQSTLTLQRVFTLLIGLLVVGSFFRIQALQKVAQVGVLKAIGVSSWSIGLAALVQIFAVNAFGVFLGALLTYGAFVAIPPTVPIRFDGNDAASAIALLLIIGPVGGMLSVRVLLKAEPLKALGLAS